ncbi:MAG: hypothetical protein ACREVE_13770 [Gammaproteobacteria bacterium]
MKVKTGRPSKFTQALADEICNRLIDGESLRAICKLKGMPGMSTVMEWCEKHDDFRSRYARAREAQAEVMDDEIMKIGLSTTTKNAAANRVKFEALRWRAAKLAPKKYGDSTTLKHADSAGEAPPRFIIDLSAANK